MKVGALGERCWCLVNTVHTDGVFTASVANDLVLCPWKAGDEVMFREGNILEVASLSDRGRFVQMVLVSGSRVDTPVHVARAFARERVSWEDKLVRAGIWESHKGTASLGEVEAFEVAADDCKKSFQARAHKAGYGSLLVQSLDEARRNDHSAMLCFRLLLCGAWLELLLLLAYACRAQVGSSTCNRVL